MLPMWALGLAMAAACVLQVVVVARTGAADPLYLLAPALVLVAMLDTCVLESAVLPGAVWAGLVVLAVGASAALAPARAGSGHGWHLAGLVVTAALLVLPGTAPAPATAAAQGASGHTMSGHASGMHHAPAGTSGVPDWLWWSALGLAVAVAVVLAVITLRPGTRPRRALAFAGLAEVGLMAAMVLPATT